MYDNEHTPNHFPALLDATSFLKIGALSTAAGGLFEANALVHFSEKGLTSAQGACALILGGLAFKAASGAFSEAFRLMHGGDDAPQSSYGDF